METSEIARIIRDRAAANGVDPAVLLRIAQVESSLNPNAGASSSSAKGLFQFTNGTAQQYGLANPYDPVANADAGARLLRDNAASLGTSDPGSLYLAHFAGLGGAQKLLAADPSASAESVLGSAVVKANPFLAGMSVQDVRNWAAGRMSGGAPPNPGSGQASAPAGDANQPAPAPQMGGTATDQSPADTASDAALSALRNIYAQQTDALPVPQMNLLRQIVSPRRTVYLG